MRITLVSIALLLTFISTHAQKFEDYFEDRTLRLDYTFSGNQTHSEIYVDELVSMPRWYGKRERLAEVPLKGNGQVIVRTTSGDKQIIYRNSFSTLYQEWLSTE
jgi:hypothetical protein